MPAAASVRIGVLNDMANAAPAPGDVTPWIEREIAVLRSAGRIGVPVEIVHAYGLGLPSGSTAAVERAFDELIDRGVALIVGPAIGDNALALAPRVERARCPTLNWAGAERARGDYLFQLQVGSHEQESIELARHLQALGARRVAVIHDRSSIGDRHLECFDAEARVLGLLVVAVAGIDPLAATAPVEALLAPRPDAFVYLGLGVSAPAVAQSLAATTWKGTRVMNTAGLRGYQGDFARAVDGWTYVDLHSDGNRTLASLSVSAQQAYSAAKGHDLGRLVAEAIARAPGPSRDGLRQGLERIDGLPAAQGHEGTLLGFGPGVRGALHGRYLVLRRWERGRSIEV